MNENKKRTGIIIGLLIIMIVAAIIFSIKTKDSKGNGREDGTVESVTTEVMTPAEEETAEDKASEVTILENQGDVEITVPEDMGDGGF